REKARTDSHIGPAFGAAFAPDDDSTLVTGGNDWTVRSWDVSGNRPTERHPLFGHLSSVPAVAFTPDGTALVSGGEDHAVRLSDLTRPPPRPRTLSGPDAGPVRAVACAPDGHTVVASGAKGLLQQWDAATGKRGQPCEGPPVPVGAVAYLPDGRR